MTAVQGNTNLGIDVVDIATTLPQFVPQSYTHSTSKRPQSNISSLTIPDKLGDSEEQEKTLTAEKIFDASVYGVWNYGLHAAAAVGAAMWFRDGGGRPYFKKAADWMGKNVMRHIIRKRGAAAAEESHTWLLFGSLITVGNLFIPPMHYVEQHKAHYVSKINDWLNERRTRDGDAPSTEELAEQQRQIELIAEEPTQSAGSLWTARAVGLGGNLLASYLVGEANNKAIQKAVSNGVSHGLNRIGLKSLGQSSKMKSLSQIAFMEYGYTLISANIVYLYSHLIHPPKKEEKPSSEVAAEQIQSARNKPLLTAGGLV